MQKTKITKAQELDYARAQDLHYLVKTYDGITSLLVKSKQRLIHMGGDKKDKKYDIRIREMESLQGKLSREIAAELKGYPIWTEWMEHVPGMGPFLAGKLIMLYYYRNIPICKACGGDLEKNDGTYICEDCGYVAKGEGILQFRMERREFPNISKWWAFMGRHTKNGVMPKRAKGAQSNWSTVGRTITYLITEQFNSKPDDHRYKEFMLRRKLRHMEKNPEWKKGHIHNAAKNETAKLFLAHFWHVARTIEGLPVTEPYAGTILGHTGIIAPFYWNEGQNTDENTPQAA